MKVVTRLYLAVVPAVIGVFLVAALAYWGERGRQAPASVLVIAVVASVMSLVAAWHNSRYVAKRITDLALARATLADTMTRSTARVGAPDEFDELDEIEATVSDLSREVVEQRLAGERRARSAEQRADEYAELIDGVVTTMGGRLEQARLPLHILLSSPFGDLNENQEEMLDAARRAVDGADADLTRLRKLIDIDRGVVALRLEPVTVSELFRAPLAIAKARAAAAGVRVVADIPDSICRVVADQTYTQEALTALITDVVARAEPGAEVRVRAADTDPARVIITVEPSLPTDRPPLDVRLARRILERQGGAAVDVDGAYRIELGRERA